MIEGYYPLVIKELKRMGYVFDRNAKGSHERWTNPGSTRAVIVPRNLYSRHTATASCGRRKVN